MVAAVGLLLILSREWIQMTICDICDMVELAEVRSFKARKKLALNQFQSLNISTFYIQSPATLWESANISHNKAKLYRTDG